MKRHVYVVTSGHYSDYGISGLFSTREKAEAFMKAVPGDEYNEIEEYEVNPDCVDKINHGYSVFEVYMLRNGDVESVIKLECGTYEVTKIGKNNPWKKNKDPHYSHFPIVDPYSVNVWAKSEKHAVKIVNEMRTRTIASEG